MPTSEFMLVYVNIVCCRQYRTEFLLTQMQIVHSQKGQMREQRIVICSVRKKAAMNSYKMRSSSYLFILRMCDKVVYLLGRFRKTTTPTTYNQTNLWRIKLQYFINKMDFQKKNELNSRRVYGHWSLAKTKFSCQTKKPKTTNFSKLIFHRKKKDINENYYREMWCFTDLI